MLTGHMLKGTAKPKIDARAHLERVANQRRRVELDALGIKGGDTFEGLKYFDANRQKSDAPLAHFMPFVPPQNRGKGIPKPTRPRVATQQQVQDLAALYPTWENLKQALAAFSHAPAAKPTLTAQPLVK